MKDTATHGTKVAILTGIVAIMAIVTACSIWGGCAVQKQEPAKPPAGQSAGDSQSNQGGVMGKGADKVEASGVKSQAVGDVEVKAPVQVRTGDKQEHFATTQSGQAGGDQVNQNYESSALVIKAIGGALIAPSILLMVLIISGVIERIFTGKLTANQDKIETENDTEQVRIWTQTYTKQAEILTSNK